MFPLVSIGPLSAPSGPLILLLGIWLGSALMASRAKARQRPQETLERILWTGFSIGIIGARLSYIARNPWAFQGQILNFASLNPALLDPLGGALLALAACYYQIAKHDLDPLEILDDFVPFFAVLAPAIYLALAASGSAFGSPTELPWGIQLWGAARHPVQFYYLGGGLAVLGYVCFAPGPRNTSKGRLFSTFSLLTFSYLLLFSAFQAPAGQLVLGFRGFQALCWILFSASVIIFFQLTQESSHEQT